MPVDLNISAERLLRVDVAVARKLQKAEPVVELTQDATYILERKLLEWSGCWLLNLKVVSTCMRASRR